MNKLLPHFSKTLAMLAVIMLPVEQALAENCCCRGGKSNEKQVSTTSQATCCSSGESTCCSTAPSSDGSCCEEGQTQTGSKPCQCPAGCFGKDAPKAIDASGITFSDIELSQAIVPMALHEVVCEAPFHSVQLSTSEATSGSQRCVLLCRYRL